MQSESILSVVLYMVVLQLQMNLNYIQEEMKDVKQMGIFILKVE